MKSIVALFFIAFFISACSVIPGTPGYISTSKSAFDGMTQINMEPASVYQSRTSMAGSGLKLSLAWRPTMGDQFWLTTQVDGSSHYVQGESLKILIDGIVVGFEGDGQSTIKGKDVLSRVAIVDFGDVSTQEYLIDRWFLEQMLSGDDVRVRVELEDGFVDGFFTDRTNESARSAFERFLARVDEATSG